MPKLHVRVLRQRPETPARYDHFDVDEECLAWGAALQAINALAILER